MSSGLLASTSLARWSHVSWFRCLGPVAFPELYYIPTELSKAEHQSCSVPVGRLSDQAVSSVGHCHGQQNTKRHSPTCKSRDCWRSGAKLTISGRCEYFAASETRHTRCYNIGAAVWRGFNSETRRPSLSRLWPLQHLPCFSSPHCVPLLPNFTFTFSQKTRFLLWPWNFSYDQDLRTWSSAQWAFRTKYCCVANWN